MNQRKVLSILTTSDERLDDIARARIWARLAPNLTASRSWRPRIALAAGMAVAAAVVVAAVVIVARGSDETPEIAMVAPDHGLLVAPLGPHADATLVGPARLVVEATGDITAVRLLEGTLYSEFHGGPGRALRIEAAGALIEVVGTLFAVDVHGGVACVAVAHGRVSVTANTVRTVGTGERACVRAGVVAPNEPIDPQTREALAHHAARWMAIAQSESAVAAGSAGAVALPRLSPAVPPPPPTIASPSIAAQVILPVAPARSASHELSDAPIAPVADAAEPDADALYAIADAALARGDRDTADLALAKLVAEAPRSPLVDEALYERGRIAFDRRAWSAARLHLDVLAARVPSSLSEPGSYLRCRVAVASVASDAAACLTAYRAAYPRGPHDLDALRMLVTVAYRSGGCDAARVLIVDLVRADRVGSEARAWQTRCEGQP